MERAAGKLKEHGSRTSFTARGAVMESRFEDKAAAEKAVKAVRERIANEKYDQFLKAERRPDYNMEGKEVAYTRLIKKTELTRKTGQGAKLLEKLRKEMEK